MRTILAAVLILAAVPAAAAPARSGRASPGPGGQFFSVWGVVDPGPFEGIGAGGRLTFPLVPQGVIRSASVRDEFTLELGADFVHYNDRVGWPYYYDYSWNGVLAVGGVAWNFWFTPRFAAYPKLDLGWWFGWYRGPYGDGRHDFDGIFLQGALGLIYRFQSVAFRLELGSELVRIGVAVPF